MPSSDRHRIDAWTAVAAEPAVRAAERAIVTGSGAVLADTLSTSVATEARRRLGPVLELERRADGNPELLAAYDRAARDLRAWAAGVYLATLGVPTRPEKTTSTPVGKRGKALTEESISLRRSVPRGPFPGQRKRRPGDAAAATGIRDGERTEDRVRARHRPAPPRGHAARGCGTGTRGRLPVARPRPSAEDDRDGSDGTPEAKPSPSVARAG